MSRKESRASVAARRKAIAQRRERAQRAIEASPDASSPAGPITAAARRANVREARAVATTAVKPTVGDARLWNALLIGGAAIAFGLLGRQLVDVYQDRSRPKLLQNDIYSALGSVALLIIIGAFAYNRWRTNGQSR